MGIGDDPLSSYAVRDIKAGEELIENYGCFKWPEWFVKIYYEFNPEMDYFRFKLQPGVAGYQIAYKVKKCKYGKGIFAEEDIKKGAIIWKYKRGINVRSFKGENKTRARLAQLPSDDARKDWLSHMYHFGGYCNEIIDDNKFTNHSSNPNSSQPNPTDPHSTYAIKHIKKGEQILENYGVYDWPSWLVNLMEEYGAEGYYETSLL